MELKFLPLGSTCLVDNSDLKLVIIGYKLNGFDYVAIEYPVGYENEGSLKYFNHDQIKDLYSFGYKDELGKIHFVSLNDGTPNAVQPEEENLEFGLNYNVFEEEVPTPTFSYSDFSMDETVEIDLQNNSENNHSVELNDDNDNDNDFTLPSVEFNSLVESEEAVISFDDDKDLFTEESLNDNTLELDNNSFALSDNVFGNVDSQSSEEDALFKIDDEVHKVDDNQNIMYDEPFTFDSSLFSTLQSVNEMLVTEDSEEVSISDAVTTNSDLSETDLKPSFENDFVSEVNETPSDDVNHIAFSNAEDEIVFPEVSESVEQDVSIPESNKLEQEDVSSEEIIFNEDVSTIDEGVNFDIPAPENAVVPEDSSAMATFETPNETAPVEEKKKRGFFNFGK